MLQIGADLAQVVRSLRSYVKIDQFLESLLNRQRGSTNLDHVHIDIVGPLPYSDCFKDLLTCVDRFTRWPEAIPLLDIRTKTVADAFFNGWVARFGTPATITTDRGAQFESRLGQFVQSIWNCQKSYTELPHSVEWHGRAFLPPAQSRYYGTRITEPVDKYVTRSIAGHPITCQGNVRQIGRRDDLRNNT